MMKRNKPIGLAMLSALTALVFLSLSAAACSKAEPTPAPTPVVTPKPAAASPSPAPKADTPRPQTPKPSTPKPQTTAPPSPKPLAKPVNIQLGIVSDLTGPTATTATGEIWGWEDAAKWANANNYVPGVTFSVVSYDNRFDVGRSLNGYELMKTRGISVIHMQMTGANYALKDKYSADKIVEIGPESPKALHPPGWVFTPGSAYSDQAAAAYEWIRDDWKKTGKTAKAKIAWLTWDADYGYSGLIANWYARDLGLDVLPTEFYPSPSPRDVSAQLLRLKDQGADYVLSMGPDAGWSVILNDAHRMGLTSKVKFIGVGNVIYSADLARLSKDAAEGSYLVMAFASLYEEDLPGVKLLRQMQEQYRGEWRDNQPGVRGWLSVKMIVEAVKLAISKDGVPPDKIDGAAVYKSLETNIKDWDTGGLTGPLTLSPDNHSAARTVKMLQMKAGKHVPVTDWFKAPHITKFDEVKK